ncbi:hypothetical protein EVAR_98316_1 [Eumeta japonica]|uniref:Uncharacterized protein n=1 Tax=Eumeta variegata TaxID=151549 RepID=A0A4C1XBF4_EUMVA|nr:hypothetical protein EVAR_98316_1 [Eumeta japonica]
MKYFNRADRSAERPAVRRPVTSGRRRARARPAAGRGAPNLIIHRIHQRQIRFARAGPAPKRAHCRSSPPAVDGVRLSGFST